jgi:hypothetical protein
MSSPSTLTLRLLPVGHIERHLRRHSSRRLDHPGLQRHLVKPGHPPYLQERRCCVRRLRPLESERSRGYDCTPSRKCACIPSRLSYFRADDVCSAGAGPLLVSHGLGPLKTRPSPSGHHRKSTRVASAAFLRYTPLRSTTSSAPPLAPSTEQSPSH